MQATVNFQEKEVQLVADNAGDSSTLFWSDALLQGTRKGLDFTHCMNTLHALKGIKSLVDAEIAKVEEYVAIHHSEALK